jgi:chromosome segregation ATPase
VVAETIRNFVFWTALAATLGLLFSLLFIYWLLLDRARRLEISTNILTQIANAYLDARDHALAAIEKHNHLADDYNALAERMATLEQRRAENRNRIRNNSQETAPDDVALGSATTVDSLQQRLRTPDRPDVESDAQVRQRFANQISALQEKNKTLRASLNETLAQLEQIRRQQSAATGV